ncbi:MAG: glycoside hydrolase family 28 protein [Bacteroidales bacterium]|nr:glycoside hydrolase family 28 protein [Bacteroidales bacterium]
MKHIIAIFLLCLLAVPAFAGQYSKYYKDTPIELKQVKEPSIPKRSVKLTDFGAKGDGISLCTDAFRQGIEALSAKGGGHLIVPNGVWLTGPITMASNIDIHLEENALVIFSPDKSLYDDKINNGRYEPLIGGEKLHDISFTGSGIFDGNGKYWRPVKRGKMSDVEWKQYRKLGGTVTEKGDLWLPYDLKAVGNQTENAQKEEGIRNDLVRLIRCKNVLFQGVTFQNAPRFHVHPIVCENVIIDGVLIRCEWNVQNGDAIDLANVKRALVVNTVINAGDDGICLKGGTGAVGVKQGPCEDILIQDCIVYHAHGGFVLGSDISGGIHKIVCRNLTLSGTDVGLRFKSGLGRGGKTSQIYCYDIMMNDIKNEAVIFDCTYINKSVASQLTGPKKETNQTATATTDDYAPEFNDIKIYNVTCRESQVGIRGKGLEGRNCVHDIDIHDCTFFYMEKATDIDANSSIKTSNINYATY